MPGEACGGGRSSDEGKGGPLRPTRELSSLQTQCSEFKLLQRGTQVPGPRVEMGTPPLCLQLTPDWAQGQNAKAAQLTSFQAQTLKSFTSKCWFCPFADIMAMQPTQVPGHTKLHLHNRSKVLEEIASTGRETPAAGTCVRPHR